MAAGGSMQQLCDESTCPICLQYFKDPVILDNCAHNFCRACILQWLQTTACCPQCKKALQQSNCKPNRTLANITQITQKLQEERRQERQQGKCEKHHVPFHLFCKDDQTSICYVCSKSKEHRNHETVPVEEVAQHYKEKIEVQLKSLKKQIGNLQKQMHEKEQERQVCLRKLEEEKQKTSFQFQQMQRFVELNLKSRLRELKSLKKEVEERHQAIVNTCCQEILRLGDLDAELNAKRQQPAGRLLQDIGSTLSRCQRKEMGFMMDLSLTMKEKFRIYSHQTSAFQEVIANYRESVESLEKSPTKVCVTLDQDTAHPSLILSEGLKSVVMGDTERVLPDNPGRFDFMHCLLGCEAFTSGRHWWDLEVHMQLGRKVAWAVGVARKSVNRKGLFIPSPDVGIWAVGKPLDVSPNQLLAYTSVKMLPLTVSCKLRKIRVSLDYEKGCVEFCDADTDDAIFTFHSVSFEGEIIHPYFWLWQGVKLDC